MWNVKHFRSTDVGMQWVNSHAVEWYQIFCENKSFSIMYRKLKPIRMAR